MSSEEEVAILRAQLAEAQGEAKRLRAFVEHVARICLGGAAAQNQSCRELYPNPDPDGLGENMWCWACQARPVLEALTPSAPAQAGTP